MRTVHKYPLSYSSETLQALKLPKDAEILDTQAQVGLEIMGQERIALWALVDTDAPLETRYFDVSDTGERLGERCELFWIATIQRHSERWGNVVHHVFEVLREKP